MRRDLRPSLHVDKQLYRLQELPAFPGHDLQHFHQHGSLHFCSHLPHNLGEMEAVLRIYGDILGSFGYRRYIGDFTNQFDHPARLSELQGIHNLSVHHAEAGRREKVGDEENAR